MTEKLTVCWRWQLPRRKKPGHKAIKKGVDEVNAMLQRFRAQLEQDLAELRDEEETLRSQLLSEVINERFIGQWDTFASRVGDRIAEYGFKKRRETLESLRFKGTLGVDNGERVVWVYLFDTFADTVYLDRDVGNSVDNLPSLVTGDEPGRDYWKALPARILVSIIAFRRQYSTPLPAAPSVTGRNSAAI